MSLIIDKPRRQLTRRINKAVRDEWIHAVETLISDAEEWSRAEADWTVTRGLDSNARREGN